ncbi:DUF2909 domain-containing protein [Salinispirillum sp. LH 10-3-1]|uniref:DUF2909 domain-containing protein n=1 Tax=Salinispirillum sp. LH 10-3-1 TaxID=2952525 RepID=A0AB38YFI6_9GAMM
MLKILIVLLTIAMIIALITAAKHLWTTTSGQKTQYWLMWRVALAVTLIVTILFGVFSGQLTMQAPWHGTY